MENIYDDWMKVEACQNNQLGTNIFLMRRKETEFIFSFSFWSWEDESLMYIDYRSTWGKIRTNKKWLMFIIEFESLSCSVHYWNFTDKGNFDIKIKQCTLHHSFIPVARLFTNEEQCLSTHTEECCGVWQEYWGF